MTHLFARLKSWLGTQFATTKTVAAHASQTVATGQNDHENVQDVVPYDENLLERSRTQWQFGDWASLVALERDTLQHHPDRAKLALLAATGHSATGNAMEARQYTRLALHWGVSKKLLTRILAAGVHNSLGRAAAIAGEQPRALQHFEAAIQTGSPESDRRLLTQARVNEQLGQLGLLAAPLGTLSAVPPAPTFLVRPQQ